MPKVLTSKIHAKTQEILDLVRKPSSQQRVNAFFGKLSETDRLKVALDLYENIELVFYQQKQLQKTISDIYIKHMADFEELIGKFVKYSVQPQGVQIATDIIERYDINQFSNDDINLILVATKDGNVALVEALLKKGADPTIESPIKHWSAWSFILEILGDPIHIKMAGNYQKIFDIFIKHGVNPVSGHTLHYLAELNNPEQLESFTKLPHVQFVDRLFNTINNKLYAPIAIQDLIDDYKDKFNNTTLYNLLNTRDAKGQTALIHAVRKGDLAAIKALLDLKVDANIQDTDGNTALHYACTSNDEAMCSLLIGYRNPKMPQFEASIIIKNKNQVSAHDLLAQQQFYGFLYEQQSYVLASTLVDYISSGATLANDEVLNEKITTLISGDYQINIRDVFNYFPKIQQCSLLTACAAAGNFELMKFIIESELVENIQEQLTVAILHASTFNQVKILKYLHSFGVDINYKNEHDITALQLAAQYGSDECLDFLILNGADIELRNDMGNSALDLALINGNHVAAKKLLKGNLKIAGYTDLMLAILNNDIREAALLLKKSDSKIPALTKGGFSTLMITAMQFADATDEEAKNSLFDLLLQLIPKSDVPHRNKIKYNFLQLLKSANPKHTSLSDVTAEQMFKLYNACSTPDFIKDHEGKNFLHLCTILGFDFSNLYDPILSSKIPTSELDKFINALDDDGNSPLSYLLFDTEAKFEAEHILKMIQHGAKFIRNGTEFKQSQHIKVMLEIDGYLHFNPTEIAHINDGDEEGRTVLHLACMRNKIIIARDLHTLKANVDQKDIYGRTPLHYAAQNNLLLSYTIDPSFWDITDNMGITPLVFAMQSADKATTILRMQDNASSYASNVNKILMSFYELKDLSALDKKINDICNDTNLNHRLKLAILAALKNYTRLIEPENDPNLKYVQNEDVRINFKNTRRYEIATHRILQEEFKKSERYKTGIMPKGYAIGIELEIPGFTPYSFIPTVELASLYSASLAFDATVTNTWLSSNVLQNYGDKLELVSEVINTYTKYEQFIDLCKTLKESGATVNASAGMHVHFNCRGSTLTDPSLEKFVPQKQELDYLKYVALNYIRVENLLRSFMRGGALYNLYGSAYVQVLSEYESDIKACKTVEELQAICSHNKTLDFTALNRHGTIEFRLHDSTVDPTLINAWVDCLSRLVSASRAQAAQHKAGDAYETIPNVEELVTLLITMRQYNTSWDPKWGAFKGSETVTTSAYPGKDTRPAQVQIQESPLYKLAHLFINYDKNETRDAKTRIEEFIIKNETLFSSGKFDKNSVLKDLKDLLNFTRDNPGLLENSPDIEPAISAVNTLLSRTTPKM